MVWTTESSTKIAIKNSYCPGGKQRPIIYVGRMLMSTVTVSVVYECKLVSICVGSRHATYQRLAFMQQEVRRYHINYGDAGEACGGVEQDGRHVGLEQQERQQDGIQYDMPAAAPYGP